MHKYIKKYYPQHSKWFYPRDIEKCKSINVLNELNDKNHMVISIGPLTKSSMPS